MGPISCEMGSLLVGLTSSRFHRAVVVGAAFKLRGLQWRRVTVMGCCCVGLKWLTKMFFWCKVSSNLLLNTWIQFFFVQHNWNKLNNFLCHWSKSYGWPVSTHTIRNTAGLTWSYRKKSWLLTYFSTTKNTYNSLIPWLNWNQMKWNERLLDDKNVVMTGWLLRSMPVELVAHWFNISIKHGVINSKSHHIYLCSHAQAVGTLRTCMRLCSSYFGASCSTGLDLYVYSITDQANGYIALVCQQSAYKKEERIRFPNVEKRDSSYSVFFSHQAFFIAFLPQLVITVFSHPSFEWEFCCCTCCYWSARSEQSQKFRLHLTVSRTRQIHADMYRICNLNHIHTSQLSGQEPHHSYASNCGCPDQIFSVPTSNWSHLL